MPKVKKLTFAIETPLGNRQQLPLTSIMFAAYRFVGAVWVQEATFQKYKQSAMSNVFANYLI
jgi:hypothetical protein